MTTYMELIESTPMVKHVETTLTTGDLEYDGTAIEVRDEAGNELFHVVVDSDGERQFRFFQSNGSYRISLQLLEEIIVAAKEKVNYVDL